MDFWANVLSPSLTPRVMHSLPGRLRVHIPILKNVPHQWRAIANSLPQFLKLIPGVDSVSCNLVSGNVLVRFDQRLLDEHQLCAYLQRGGELLLQQRSKLQRVTPQELPAFIAQLADSFANNKKEFG